MPFTILPHTADIRLRVTGKNLEEVFRDALRGMAAIQKKDLIKTDLPQVSRTASLAAADPTALLVDFLNEALSLSTINKEIYREVHFEKLTSTELRVQLSGIPMQGFDEDIKAVTYHEAEIKQTESGAYETTLIFDI